MAIGAWENPDGVQVRFGDYHSNLDNRKNRARVTNSVGEEKELTVEFDLTSVAAGAVSFTADLDNDGTLDGFSPHDASLPANSYILRAKTYVKTAAAAGTSINIGLHQADGTVIDLDGIDAAIATASLTDGALIDNNGALVGAQIGANAGYVSFENTGTFTAGVIRVIITYVEEK